MALQRMFSGDPSKSSTLYLVIGGLSLVKAIAVRKDPDRFRRELLDAGLFIGAGLVLRRYSRLKEEKRREIQTQLPDWAMRALEQAGSARSGRSGSGPGSQTGLRARAKQRFGSEPEPQPSLREKAMQAVSERR